MWINLVDRNKVVFVSALQACENMCECDGWQRECARAHPGSLTMGLWKSVLSARVSVLPISVITACKLCSW